MKWQHYAVAGGLAYLLLANVSPFTPNDPKELDVAKIAAYVAIVAGGAKMATTF